MDNFDLWCAAHEEDYREDNRKAVINKMLQDEEVTRLRRKVDELKFENEDLKVAYDMAMAACKLNSSMYRRFLEEKIVLNDKVKCLTEDNASLRLEVDKLKGLIKAAKEHVGMANLMLA